MSEIHAWCKKRMGPMKELVDSLRTQVPSREQREPINDVKTLMRMDEEISTTLTTLRYVSKKRKLFKEIAVGLSGQENSPDYAYFGPAPHFSLGDPGGVASGVGFAADGVLAFLDLWKQERAHKKEVKQYQKDLGPLKNRMLNNYCLLVSTLDVMVGFGAISEKSGDDMFKNGFNLPIANKAWNISTNYKWLAVTA